MMVNGRATPTNTNGTNGAEPFKGVIQDRVRGEPALSIDRRIGRDLGNAVAAARAGIHVLIRHADFCDTRLPQRDQLGAMGAPGLIAREQRQLAEVPVHCVDSAALAGIEETVQ